MPYNAGFPVLPSPMTCLGFKFMRPNSTVAASKFQSSLRIHRYSHSAHGPVELASMLQDCAKSKKLSQGKLIHSSAIKLGLGNHTFLCNNVLNMYVKCGCLEDARQVFDLMRQRSVVTWTSMITAYGLHGSSEEALRLFDQMQQHGVPPNHYTISAILKVCSTASALHQGRYVHKCIKKSPHLMDTAVRNALINLYVKCGCITDARQVFDDMTDNRNIVSWNAIMSGYFAKRDVKEGLELFQQIPNPDVVSWNTVMSGLGQNELFGEMLGVFREMQRAGVRPDKFSFASVLHACAGLNFLTLGRQVHSQIILNGLQEDASWVTALLDMYGKCRDLDDAAKLFDGLVATSSACEKTTGFRTAYWNAMLTGYVQNGLFGRALDLFCQMWKKGVPMDHFTFGSVLSASGCLLALDLGRQIHAHAVKTGQDLDLIVGGALVDMYAKCKEMEEACRAFELLPAWDKISCTSIIVGCVHHGWTRAALEYFRKMVTVGMDPDDFTYAIILTACAHIGSLEQGRQLHARFITGGFDCIKTLGVVLLDEKGHLPEAQYLSNQGNVSERSVDEPKPNLLDMYSKCGSMIDPSKAYPDPHNNISFYNKAEILPFQERDIVVSSAIVDMYAKCSSIEDAYKVFCKMPMRDVVAWTSMITGYAQHGEAREALVMFNRMIENGIKPNEITFVGVLNACSHGGLVDEGFHYFDLMTRAHNLTPRTEHYSCMVDLLGRAGYLKEADSFIAKMPIEPPASIWESLLGACTAYGDVNLARKATENLLKLKQNDSSTKNEPSNIYAAQL